MAKPESSVRGSRWSLKGMTALVTGGTRGIGHAVVEELADFGATVYTCSRNEEELDKCLKEWRDRGFTVYGSVCDVSFGPQRQKLIEDVASELNGKLNILVNNVGTNIRKPTVDYNAEDYMKLMNTNFDSAYHLCQLAYSLLKASGNGSIVFISSVAGLSSIGSGTIYAAGKAAINQLTKCLACEWAKDNIRSNCVAPWYTKTSLVEHLLEDREFMNDILARTPVKRIAEAHEVSSLVAFLCLPAASYINGQVVSVDGGMTVNAFQSNMKST
ncbi:tropinone reductase homolog At5g06060 [Neltuma alba]|uniref:tropinone reductase homolog At5g06060 n=1 Tax=Neltuma alba TaxID=207710 RepID=UPI0010A42829|nr:tropinone reductase homolog At5g06060-like [Prosopis alba]